MTQGAFDTIFNQRPSAFQPTVQLINAITNSSNETAHIFSDGTSHVVAFIAPELFELGISLAPLHVVRLLDYHIAKHSGEDVLYIS